MITVEGMESGGENTSIGKYIDNSLKASLQIGGAIVRAFLIFRGTELLAYTATGGKYESDGTGT